MDEDMDFAGTQAGPVFPPTVTIQQQQQYVGNGFQEDRKMLYVLISGLLIRSLYKCSSHIVVAFQRPRLCSGLHRKPRKLHLLSNKEHRRDMQPHLRVRKAAGPRRLAYRPRGLQRPSATRSYVCDEELWFFVGYYQGPRRSVNSVRFGRR